MNAPGLLLDDHDVVVAAVETLDQPERQLAIGSKQDRRVLFQVAGQNIG